jgi:hypothetical protein
MIDTKMKIIMEGGATVFMDCDRQSFVDTKDAWLRGLDGGDDGTTATFSIRNAGDFRYDLTVRVDRVLAITAEALTPRDGDQ